MDFEWDTNKAAINLAKHGVSFETAARAFFDPFLVEVKEEDYGGEMRYSVIGAVAPPSVRHLYDAWQQLSDHLGRIGRAP